MIDNFQFMLEEMSQRLDTHLYSYFSFLKPEVKTIDSILETEGREEGHAESRSEKQDKSDAIKKVINTCPSRNVYQDARKYIFRFLDSCEVDLSHDKRITELRETNTMTKKDIEYLFRLEKCQPAFEKMFSSNYLQKELEKETNPMVKARLLRILPNLELGFNDP